MSPVSRSSDDVTTPRVYLVSLPWTTLTEPSLGLSILKAVLTAAGVHCVVRHLNLEMLRFLRPVTYYALANVFALNEFLFSGVLELEVSPHQTRILREKVLQLAGYGIIDLDARGGVDGLIRDLLHLRAHTIPQWLEQAADQVVADRPTLVGFTCMFDQTIASVALAKLIRRRAPDCLLALGGYAVREPTGPALLRAFPWIDAICTSEGENVIIPLANASAAGGLDSVPGILFRRAGDVITLSPPAKAVAMDSVPTPDFGDFFRDIDDLAGRHGVRIPIERLPIENSRGCWWGAKHHCTFCGIHDDDMHFRARSASTVLRDMAVLQARFGITAFRFSDYILPHQYYRTLLPELIRRGSPYRLTSEMKANVTANRFALLAQAGFEEVQPGIEAFSSRVLRSMHKGVTAVRNVHTLLLARRHGVLAHYNLLYGFPDDDPADYAETLRLLPRLRHLDPPSTRLEVQVTRFAPLQADPARFGILPARYDPSYELLLSVHHRHEIGLDLGEVCYYFVRPFENAPRLNQLYRLIDRAVDAWKALHSRGEVELRFDYRNSKCCVFDSRTGTPTLHRLSPQETNLLLACDAPQPEASFQFDPSWAAAMHRLDDLGLIFREGGEVVSLVLGTLAASVATARPMRRKGGELPNRTTPSPEAPNRPV